MKIQDNEGAYIGDGGQLRVEPVRKPKWDREGIHALLGFIVAMWPLAALVWGTDMLLWSALAMQPVALLLFLAYEITEGWRINDWSYRDIGGYMIGWIPGIMTFLTVGILIFKFA